MDLIITITASNAATGELTMTDAGTTNVDPGDQVTWVLGPNCGVASITAITEKPMSFDVFNPDPAPVPNSTNWQGTVNPNIGRGIEEMYNIAWTTAGTGWLGKDGAGQPKTFDPIIRIKA
jgi:hypothetical protein